MVRDVHNAALGRPHTLVAYALYRKRPLPFGALVVRPRGPPIRRWPLSGAPSVQSTEAVSLTVIAISVAACVLPARTAIRTDVSRVLRFE